MNFSKKTIDILTNFSTINKSILFRKGTELKTISESKSVFARATISEKLPKEFAIYDLPRLLGVISLFVDPDFDFAEDAIKIKEGKKTLKYKFTEPSMIISPSQKDPDLGKAFFKFDLSKDLLINLTKTLGVMQFPSLIFVGNDDKLSLQCADPEKRVGDESTEDYYSVDVDAEKVTGEFNVLVKQEYINLLYKDNYVVSGYKIKAANEIVVIEFASDNITYLVVSDVGTKA